MKYYYAETDSFSGDDPRDYTHGFANTKEPVAFTSKRERDAWLSSTKLMTARKLIRAEAARDAFTIYGWHRGCRVYGTDSHVVLVLSKW